MEVTEKDFVRADVCVCVNICAFIHTEINAHIFQILPTKIISINQAVTPGLIT